MSNTVWVQKKSIYCDRVNQTVHLLEERIYPADQVPDVGQPYQVRGQKCSAGLVCNLHGLRCHWSGLNPGYDPFIDSPAQ